MALTTQSITNNYTDIPYDRYLEFRVVHMNQPTFFYSQSSKYPDKVTRPVGTVDEVAASPDIGGDGTRIIHSGASS